MDALRGSDFGADDLGPEPDDVIQAPPPVIGQDERRMQVRAYNYWAGLLGKRRFPAPDRLIAGDMPEFATNSVLLHFGDGIEDPTVLALGDSLAAECGDTPSIGRLSQVPGRSVLSRITDHYLQIIANEAPIGFEAEFVNLHGATILYRGILLPFSTDDATIDYIYGVINWKELADQRTTDELMLEIGQALDGVPVTQRRRASTQRDDDAQAGAWADGPAVTGARSGWEDDPAAPLDQSTLDLSPFIDSPAHTDDGPVPARPGTTGTAQVEPHTLTEWLEKARASALRALANEDRTRQSLYAAIGRAWDFALAAEAAPDDYARLVAEAGLVPLDRAPLIPLVKLVFGADYDKTRLTEYATVLGHARRLGLGKGELADVLGQSQGGIKAIIARERAAKRGEERATAPRNAWQATARGLPARPLTDLPRDGAEFALVLVRRLPGGDLAMLGEIADDAALLARAARHFMA
jgi:GNAT superfamily N-acetyltransferase